nr:uncharacterized protein CTRU02_01480 [Colletotrichum truncatum]KAF6799801.1 hypothetical protein CTRU02_01480 [Colletotrichum truncatum]
MDLNATRSSSTPARRTSRFSAPTFDFVFYIIAAKFSTTKAGGLLKLRPNSPRAAEALFMPSESTRVDEYRGAVSVTQEALNDTEILYAWDVIGELAWLGPSAQQLILLHNWASTVT